jgi:hypothetical protein
MVIRCSFDLKGVASFIAGADRITCTVFVCGSGTAKSTHEIRGRREVAEGHTHIHPSQDLLG